MFVLCFCLEKYVERLHGFDKNIKTFPCPTCGTEITLKSNQDVAGLASNHFIMSMLEIIALQEKAKASPQCSDCEDWAINHCASCEIFLCKKCSQSHDRWIKNHNMLSMEELVKNPESQAKIRSKLYCEKHKEEVLKYYCETCKELCCIDCVVLKHQKENHSCVAVSDVAPKQRETLQSSCSTLDEKLSEGKEALNNICEVMKALEKNVKTAKDQIKEQKENILKFVGGKLEDRVKKLNEEVDKIYGELHSELSEQHDEIKEYLDKLQVTMPLPKNLLQRGSIEEMLSSQKLIDENIEKLRNDQPEDLVAVNDGVIQYVPGNIVNINVNQIVDKLGCIKGTGEIDCSFINIQHKIRHTAYILCFGNMFRSLLTWVWSG